MVHRTYYRETGKRTYRYYHCPSAHFPQLDADTAEKLVEQAFLEEVGKQKGQIRVFIPAESHQIELEEANRAVDELTSLVGTMTSDSMRKRLTEQLRALDETIARLETLPTSESRWEYRETDQTYQDAWESADTEGRRQLLLRSGITALVKITGKTRSSPGALEFELRVPEDIRNRLSQ